MKRCPYCGAKNKGTFEYCIRCSEPLDAEIPERSVAQEGTAVPKLVGFGIAAVVVLAALALLTRGTGNESANGGASVQASSGTGGNLTAPREGPVAAGIDSKEILATFNAGLAAYRQQDYTTAIGLFQEVIQEIPDNPAAHQYLGLCYFHRQEFPEAMSAFAEARRLRPDSFEVLDHYVTAAKKAGDLESASSALRDFIQRNPDQRGPRIELSRIARESGRPEEALEQAALLANDDKSNPEFQYEYGVSLRAAGKLDEAIAALKSSVELDPNSAAAQHALGMTELQSGKANDALAPLEKAVARAPENGEFRFSLA
ncbi:MAG TPA: tetratricopeptide repeat protein, partial [Vicinamibacteria bacterium]|nr:tetratricopeptide repeat protein [Vicinamibacteria bacterium]